MTDETDQNIDPEIEITEEQRKAPWKKLPHTDSLYLEAGQVLSSITGPHSKSDWLTTLSLAFQSIGIVYGDLGTSPLYTYAGIFPEGIDDKENLLGALSLIFYTLLIIPFLKYTFVVLNANDNGVGGTFALYSLLCRNLKVSLLPNQQPEDRELSNYKLETPSSQLKRAHYIRGKLENSQVAKIILFLLTVLGVSMVMGDGILTPAMSVLSAVSGIKSLGEGTVMGISLVILVLLFSAQRFGTDKVGFSFAPIISIWFLMLFCCGIYNLNAYGWGILRAINPYHIVTYFKRRGKKGWLSLGGVILATTGTEAMFADLGHFNVRAIQLSWSFVVMPSVLSAYAGQAAYLYQYPEHVQDCFYKSIPSPIYWPSFVIAVLSAIIASQAMVSGVFSIITQSLSVGCFPRVKVIHTSAKYEGQVYIPDINYFMMVCCILVAVGFRTTEKIGNAYGIAVVAVMCITTFLVSLIMLVVWKTNIILIFFFFVILATIEYTYLTAVLEKFVQGGFFPLAFSFLLVGVMATWHYVHQKRYEFELQNKVSSDYLKQLANDPRINRVPGVGLLYSELVHGIPPIFPHFISSIPSIHSVLLFVSIKKLPICKISSEERFLFRHVEPREYRMYRCVARYGYMDAMGTNEEFEHELVDKLKEYIRNEHFIAEREQMSSGQGSSQIVSTSIQGVDEEIRFIERAVGEGVIYLLGETKVIAKESSNVALPIGSPLVANFSRAILNFTQGKYMVPIEKKYFGRIAIDQDETGSIASDTPSLTSKSFAGLFVNIVVVVFLALLVSENHMLGRVIGRYVFRNSLDISASRVQPAADTTAAAVTNPPEINNAQENHNSNVKNRDDSIEEAVLEVHSS